jgi:hypothetical protein
MNAANLFALVDAIKEIGQQTGHAITGEENVKIEVPFKKTVKRVQRIFHTETVSEIAIVRELQVEKVFYDASTNSIVIKGA